MTASTFENINDRGEIRRVWSPSVALELGKAALTRIGKTHIAFEAFMTRITTDQEHLQYVANRNDLDPQVRDRLIAQQAIRHPFDLQQ